MKGELARLLDAISFAAERHRNQRRKDHEASPYINHPIAVADTLAQVGDVTDVTILQAAILHDTIEDTPTLIFERRLSHPVDRVWEAITDPHVLVHWFPGHKALIIGNPKAHHLSHWSRFDEEPA